jgi:hypothetical protein
LRVGGRRHPGMSPMEEAAASVPKEVKARLKRSRAAKGLLMDLEEVVRRFVREWNEGKEAGMGMKGEGGDVGARKRSGTLDTEESAVLVSDDEGDDEIVFVGRNGTMLDGVVPKSPKGPKDPQNHPNQTEEEQDKEANDEWQATLAREKLVFEGCEDDKGASFARWLVHCVGSYYGLRTWSVTREVEGSGNRREAYVGIDERATGFMGWGREVGMDREREIELPRPLWGMV